MGYAISSKRRDRHGRLQAGRTKGRRRQTKKNKRHKFRQTDEYGHTGRQGKQFDKEDVEETSNLNSNWDK